MIFKISSRLTLCLLCLHTVQPAFAQGMRLTPTPALSIRAANANDAKGAVPAVVQADFIVAIVNSEPITNNEVKTRLIRYERRLAGQGAALPSRIDLAREVLEDIIREKLQLKLAKDSGIRIDERTIDAAVQTFATQNSISLAELKTRASADGIGYTQIRTDIQNQLLIQKLREKEVMGGIAISDNDIDTFIKEQLSANPSTELTIDLAQILIAIPDGATAAQIQALQSRADRIFARAKSGEDFFKLAQENSDARDARTGGQMGLRAVDRYPTLFTEATKNLKAGEIAGPIRSGAGFHLLKLLEKQLPSSNSFAITQTNPRHILLRTGPTLPEAVAKTKLLDLKKRIESRAIDFAAAAKEVSQDGSAAAGGDLGWANPGQFVPEFENVMNQLPVGKISDPIVSRFGVHLLLVEARRQNQLSAAEQRDVARNVLREKKFDDVYANWIRELRGNAYVEYRDIQP
jgi:peptidyl-prolyl cis-trans isomerase SurA